MICCNEPALTELVKHLKIHHQGDGLEEADRFVNNSRRVYGFLSGSEDVETNYYFTRGTADETGIVRACFLTFY